MMRSPTLFRGAKRSHFRALSAVLLASCLGAFACPEGASANPLDLFGAGSKAGARAGAMTAAANDATALYYNPAGMTLGKTGMSLGTLVAVDDVRIRLKERPGGYDLPNRGDASAAIPTEFRLNKRGDTEDVVNGYHFSIGVTSDLGNPALRLGAYVMMPMTRIARQVSRFPDEREQYFSNRLDFELIGERSQHPVILAGIAYRFGKLLSVGAAVNILPGADTVASVYLADATKQDEIELVVENDQAARVAAHAGLVVTPSEALAIGLSWRSANYFRLTLRNDIQIMGFQGGSDDFPVKQLANVVANYSPDQLAVGTQWKTGNLAASVDAVWMRWSGYLDYQGNNTHGFKDTVSIRAGVQHGAEGGTKLRAGLAWEPSPVPVQDGRTNYVDNDRAVASIGGGHPATVLGRQVEIGWYAQLHHLVARDTSKKKLAAYPPCTPGETSLCDELPDDTPRADNGQQTDAHKGLQTGNPGFPGWQSWGTLLAVGVDLTWSF